MQRVSRDCCTSSTGLTRWRIACLLPLAGLYQCSVAALVHVLVGVLGAVNGGADLDVDVASLDPMETSGLRVTSSVALLRRHHGGP